MWLGSAMVEAMIVGQAAIGGKTKIKAALVELLSTKKVGQAAMGGETETDIRAALETTDEAAVNGLAEMDGTAAAVDKVGLAVMTHSRSTLSGKTKSKTALGF